METVTPQNTKYEMSEKPHDGTAHLEQVDSGKDTESQLSTGDEPMTFKKAMALVAMAFLWVSDKTTGRDHAIAKWRFESRLIAFQSGCIQYGLVFHHSCAGLNNHIIFCMDLALTIDRLVRKFHSIFTVVCLHIVSCIEEGFSTGVLIRLQFTANSVVLIDGRGSSSPICSLLARPVPSLARCPISLVVDGSPSPALFC